MDNKNDKNGVKLLYLFYGAIIFVPQVILTALDKPWQTSLIFLASSIIVLIIMNPTPFKEFSIQKDGLTVKLQEAEQIITEAYATIDMMKESMDPIIRLQANILKRSGTFDQMDVYELLQARDSLLELTEYLGLDKTGQYFSDETKYRIAIGAREEIVRILSNRDNYTYSERESVQKDKIASELRSEFEKDLKGFREMILDRFSLLGNYESKERIKKMIGLIEDCI
ncbi:hypothetical protein [Enterococcus diestrammenae]|uniref:hypothetical protein n=1 Tax=Enterococcus diestrammenae TaxID=1155073 RepID=UPI0022E4B2AC|nr:hypothetical protein [Enterococcus diestrammenae]